MSLRRAQSRTMSLVEAVINVLVGFWIAVALQLVLYPAFGIRTAFGTDLAIAAIFTLVSILRSYAMRRLFERLHLRGTVMTEHKPIPVAGYTAQPNHTVEMVNANKRIEEHILRRIDAVQGSGSVDQRWLAIARTQIEQGFMAFNRAIFRPERIRLPDDPTAG